MENNVHTQEFVVEAEQAGERLDRYLTTDLCESVQKLLSKAHQRWECPVSTEKQLQKHGICLRCI